MRLIKLACPQCGAALPLTSPSMEWVTCPYCTTTFYVQRDRAQPPPMGHPYVYHQPPTSVSSGSVALAIGLAAGLIVVLSVAGLVFQRSTRTTSSPTLPVATTAPPVFFLAQRQPMLFDVNGDGADDAIVWASGGGLAAFDGNTGAQLWETSELGGRAAEEARSALYDGRLVVDFARNLYGLDPKTGKILWTTPMDGRTVHYCARGPGNFQLTTEEPECSRVDLTTGKLAPDKESFACLPIWRDLGATSEPLIAPDNAFNTSNSSIYYHFHPLPTVTGVTVEYDLPVVNGVRILMGYRKPGLLPVAVAMRGDKEIWRADIAPSAQRGNGTPPAATLSHGRLITVHDATGGWRLTALDASNGARLWESPLGSGADNVMSIRASDRVVFVRKALTLTAFAFKDGRELYKIGP